MVLISALFAYLVSSANYDQYGMEMIYKSAHGNDALNYAPNWYNQDRTINSVNVDPYSTNQACSARGNCVASIDSSTGIMKMTGSAARYYCDVNHTNVEVNVDQK